MKTKPTEQMSDLQKSDDLDQSNTHGV